VLSGGLLTNYYLSQMDSSEEKAALKKIKIKTGSLNRSVKDYNSYVKEVAQC